MDQRARNEAIRLLIEQRTIKDTATRARAREVLISEGIYDERGNLTPEYGGPPANRGAIERSR